MGVGGGGMSEGIIKGGWQLPHPERDMIKLCKSATNCLGTCYPANFVHPSKFVLWTKCRANRWATKDWDG